MASSPPYEVKSASNAGRGIYATRDLSDGDCIWEEERPFLAAIDSSKLKNACSWCFAYVWEGVEDGSHKLKVCTGCKILRFCNAKCQTAAWKHSHKLECKIYAKLYPAVLPNTARVAVQLLLRRKAALMQQEELEAFLALRHHLDDFRKNAGTDNDTFENLQLMSRAAQEYSGTGDNLGQVETVAGRILINTLTLSTSLYTPIGIAISLPSSLLNHSCAPNTVHVFSGAGHVLKAIGPIKAGTELTTSYIDNTFSPALRQAELADRYFFKCTCYECSSTQSLGRPDPPPALAVLSQKDLKDLLDMEQSAGDLVVSARGANSAVALSQLAQAYLKYFNPPASKVHYPAWRQPLATIRSELTLALITTKRWTPALILSIMQRIEIDPATFQSATHPVRVARLWILARLVSQVGTIAHEENPDPTDDPFGESATAKAFAERFQIEWGVLVWTLVSETGSRVIRSHGPNNSLTADVMRELTRLREEMRSMGGTEPSPATLKPVWERLKEIAKEGWNWWREWERTRIETHGKMIAEGEMQAMLDGMESLYSDDPI